MKGKAVWELLLELKGTLLKGITAGTRKPCPGELEFYYSKDQHWYENKAYPVSQAIFVF
jgi:hypothetical protein